MLFAALQLMQRNPHKSSNSLATLQLLQQKHSMPLIFHAVRLILLHFCNLAPHSGYHVRFLLYFLQRTTVFQMSSRFSKSKTMNIESMNEIDSSCCFKRNDCLSGYRAKGQTAVILLIAQMENEPVTDRKVMIGVELTIRQSTALISLRIFPG